MGFARNKTRKCLVNARKCIKWWLAAFGRSKWPGSGCKSFYAVNRLHSKHTSVPDTLLGLLSDTQSVKVAELLELHPKYRFAAAAARMALVSAFHGPPTPLVELAVQCRYPPATRRSCTHNRTHMLSAFCN